MRDEAVSAWWTLLKVPDHRDFISEIRDVDSPWREGFLAKSTTLMSIHVEPIRALGRAQGTWARDRCHGKSSLRICV
jgi:hypothetical protein